MRMCHVTVLPHTNPTAQGQPMGQLFHHLSWSHCTGLTWHQHSPTYLGSADVLLPCANTNQAPLNSSLGCCGLQPQTTLAMGSPGLGPVGFPVCPPRGLASNTDWFSSFPLPVGVSPAAEMAQLAPSTAGASKAATWQCRRKTSSHQARHTSLGSPFNLTQMLLKCSS